MDLGYENKVALVTGASSPIGFGRRICEVLADEGCKVIACGSTLEGASEALAAVEEHGSSGMALGFDVRDEQAVRSAVDMAAKEFGHIDVLINCAGRSKYQNKPFQDMSVDDVLFDLEVNLMGQMNVARAVIPHMIESGGGNIVNFSGGRGIPGLSVYGASKGGVNEWSHALAAEVAQYGIQVNVFGPGLSKTGLIKGQSEEFIQRVTNSTIQKRLCTPEDVASIVVFMASAKNDYMSGVFVHI